MELLAASPRGVSSRRLCLACSSRETKLPTTAVSIFRVFHVLAKRDTVSKLNQRPPQTKTHRQHCFELSRCSRVRQGRQGFGTEPAPPANQAPPPTLFRTFAPFTFAAKCDKHCDLQNSVNQQEFERILRSRDIPESMPASASTFSFQWQRGLRGLACYCEALGVEAR